MRFSLYSELQLHPGKTAEQLYAEVLEQMLNADRLGYDAYAAIEHFFFPKFSVSTNPTALFAAAAQRTGTSGSARCCTPCRTTTRRCWPAASTPPTSSPAADTSGASAAVTAGWRSGRRAARRARAPRYEEAVDLLFKALENERFSHHGTYFDVDDSHVVPFVERKYRVYLGGTSDRTYTLAAERGWGVAVPPLLPYVALEQQLDLYRASCAEHGTEPDIVWIHACHLDEDRETAHPRGARVDARFITGNASPLTEWPKAPADDLNKAGLRLLHRRDHGVAGRDAVRASWSRTTTSGSGTPAGRDRADRGDPQGVRGDPGDRDHRQRRRRAALDGDQEPGALRERGHPARRALPPPPSHLRDAAETLGRTLAAALRLDLAVTVRRCRHEVGQQVLRRVCDGVDSLLEHRLIRTGRLLHAAHLATYCSAAEWISSWVVGGSKLWRTLMFLHIPTG